MARADGLDFRFFEASSAQKAVSVNGCFRDSDESELSPAVGRVNLLCLHRS